MPATGTSVSLNSNGSIDNPSDGKSKKRAYRFAFNVTHYTGIDIYLIDQNLFNRLPVLIVV